MYWVYRVVELFSVAYNTLRSLKLLRELQQVEDAAGTSTDACTDTTAYTNDNGTTHEQRERASSAPGAHLGRKKSREAAAAGDDADTRASETLMFWVVYGICVGSSQYWEFLLQWLPGYYYLKSGAVLLVTFPQLRFTRLAFESGVVPIAQKVGGRVEEHGGAAALLHTAAYQLPFLLLAFLFPFPGAMRVLYTRTPVSKSKNTSTSKNRSRLESASVSPLSQCSCPLTANEQHLLASSPGTPVGAGAAAGVRKGPVEALDTLPAPLSPQASEQTVRGALQSSSHRLSSLGAAARRMTLELQRSEAAPRARASSDADADAGASLGRASSSVFTFVEGVEEEIEAEAEVAAAADPASERRCRRRRERDQQWERDQESDDVSSVFAFADERQQGLQEQQEQQEREQRRRSLSAQMGLLHALQALPPIPSPVSSPKHAHAFAYAEDSKENSRNRPRHSSGGGGGDGLSNGLHSPLSPLLPNTVSTGRASTSR